MNYYQDILLKPDAEMSANRLLNTVYTKLHKALCDLNSKTIGVSFPRYQVTLGNLLRVHGTEQDLKNLQQLNWIGGMTGYCNIGEVSPIPSDSQFRTVSRVQTTMSPAKLRRLIKRGTIKPDEIKQYKAKMYQKGLDNPFLELESTSNGHRHRRYLSFGDLQNKPVFGDFDQFGLSKTATVPWF